jgi:hypothetical protein
MNKFFLIACMICFASIANATCFVELNKTGGEPVFVKSEDMPAMGVVVYALLGAGYRIQEPPSVVSLNIKTPKWCMVEVKDLIEISLKCSINGGAISAVQHTVFVFGLYDNYSGIPKAVEMLQLDRDIANERANAGNL